MIYVDRLITIITFLKQNANFNYIFYTNVLIR